MLVLGIAEAVLGAESHRRPARTRLELNQQTRTGAGDLLVRPRAAQHIDDGGFVWHPGIVHGKPVGNGRTANQEKRSPNAFTRDPHPQTHMMVK